MMRGPEDVGCAHCTNPGAKDTCSICKRLVCAECGPLTCTVATGFELRLGTGSRVRAIDPAGRLALVTHPLRSLRLVDLRAGRWVGTLDGEALYPVLTGDGLLLGLVSKAIDRDTTLWTGVQARDVKTGKEAWLEHVSPLVRPELGISPNGTHVHYPTRPTHGGGYAVGVIRTPHAVTDYTLPYPYPVEAMAIDGERERLAVVGGNRVAAYEMRDSELSELTAFHLLPQHRPRWMGLGGENLVLIVEVGEQLLVTKHSMGYELSTIEAPRIPGPLGCAAIAMDGTHVAVSVGRVLCLYDVRGAQLGAVMLGGHTDDVSYLRFARDGALISADDDNRVLVRRRLGDGSYATECVRVDLTD